MIDSFFSMFYYYLLFFLTFWWLVLFSWWENSIFMFSVWQWQSIVSCVNGEGHSHRATFTMILQGSEISASPNPPPKKKNLADLKFDTLSRRVFTGRCLSYQRHFSPGDPCLWGSGGLRRLEKATQLFSNEIDVMRAWNPKWLEWPLVLIGV